MVIVYIIVGLIIGAAIGYLLANGTQRAAVAQAEMLARQLQEERAAHDQQCATLKAEHKAEVEALHAAHEQQVATLKEEQRAQVDTLKEDFTKQTEQQFALLKEQFTTASARELRTRSEELSAMNVEQLSKILTPLNERLSQMREAVEKSEKSQTEATTRLEEVCKMTYTQAETLGKTTNSLVSALSNDNKYQGDFGEMQLRQLLESMGFKRGIHFEEQASTPNENGEIGSRKQPDVVLHYPDKRDIIIDAKTSTTAFLRYNDNALSDIERQQALKDHLTAVKTQVKSLSKKDYWRDYNKKGMQLDFVVMFIPIEGAMQLALTEEPQLWEWAFEQRVFITGPQNLYALLKMIEMSWRQVAQVENQQKIIACADEIVQRVQMFYERFLKAAGALEKAKKSFDDLSLLLLPSGKSIITSARKLLDYGAREDKSPRRTPLPRADEDLSLELIEEE